MKQYAWDLLQNNPGSGVGRSNWQYTSNENVHEFNYYWICVKSKWSFPRLYSSFLYCLKSPQWLRGKESACKAGGAGDTGSIPGFGRSPGGGNGKPLQYSCLKYPMDRGTWRATVHGVAESGNDWVTEQLKNQNSSH